ncbi:hypothetical protein [Butyrivibrio sp. AE3004]|uniref:hypothetical protein n=1 Tax=Butyrivibrio sp. AE3004 TaxID=1506994 RepID=UPI000493B70D|nr:hypothetical protein [Butyrivibrio sp. AE3004]
MSEETKAQIRKYYNNLEINGLGVIVFGIWSVLKYLINMIMGQTNMEDIVAIINIGNSDTLVNVVLVIVFIVYTLVLLLHVYIGACAVYYARRKTENTRFLIWAIVLFIINLISVSNYLCSPESMEWDDTVIITLMVDFTFFYIIIDMLYSYIKIKKLSKLKEYEN